MTEYAGVTPIEIVCGREGMWGVRNLGLVPLGAAVILRNATLEDSSFRTGGGATVLGVPLAAAPTVMAGFDWWPDFATQRNVVSTSAGKISKDNGTGNAWVDLVTGLAGGGNPFFAQGGSESQGRNRKLFHCDGVNPVKVLSGDGGAMTTIASPPADWAGANQPTGLINHQGALWGWGNNNDPHRLYKSVIGNHEDFLTTVYTYSVFPGQGQGIRACASYKGGLLIWKYPRGVWYMPTTDPDNTKWGAAQAGAAGTAGPALVVVIEDDVIWVAPDLSWHLMSSTQATGSVHASDIAYKKLGVYPRGQYNQSRLQYGHLLYYSQKLEVMLALSASGQTQKNRRLHMDLNRQHDVGERWLTWDRDINESIWLRTLADGTVVPVMGDNAGQLWLLDQSARSKSGAGYTFEALLADSDFGAVVPGWTGRIKNLRYVQLEYDPRGTAQCSLEVQIDGQTKQTIAFTLTAGGLTLPFTLPGLLGGLTPQISRKRRAYGRGIRIGFRIIGTGNNADISIIRIILGVELGD